MRQHRLGAPPGLPMHWSRLPDLVAGAILAMALLSIATPAGRIERRWAIGGAAFFAMRMVGTTIAFARFPLGRSPAPHRRARLRLSHRPFRQ